VFRFITHRSFFANLLAIVVLSLVLLFVFIILLRGFTRHGDYIKVPSVKGMDISEATRALSAQGFEVSVEDSAFRDNLPKLSVVWQSPDAGEQVKVHRTVYLTVNRAIPPTVDMPNLLSLKFAFAESSLSEFRLKLGDTTYRPDFEKNRVLDMLVDGKSVKAGTKISMGTTVSLVLGAGIAQTEVPVPDLFGMRLTDARVVLEANGVQMGSVVPNGDVSDTAAAFIYRQNPSPAGADGMPNLIHAGQMIDVYVGKQIPVRADTTK
jgi:beta-lactam-binding protein with PASTA domain